MHEMILSPMTECIGLVLVYCDYLWSILSGLRCTETGGRCHIGANCGVSCLALDDMPGLEGWSVGA